MNTVTSPVAYQEVTLTSRDNVVLYYRDYADQSGGTNAPLLCIPGVTRNCRDFARFADRASATRRVICVDLRGRGKSGNDPNPMNYLPGTYLQDLVEVLDHARLDKAVFVGTSLGGIITMLASQIIPGRIHAAILNDIGPDIGEAGITRVLSYMGNAPDIRDWETASKAVEAVNAGVYPDFTRADWDYLASCTHEEAKDGRIIPSYDLNITAPFKAGAESIKSGDLMWQAFDGLKDIPTLAVRGELSDLFLPETLDAMQERMPEMNQHTTPRVGHVPLLEEDGTFNAITEFLGKLNA